MSSYLFVLGRSRELCAAELTAFFPRAGFPLADIAEVAEAGLPGLAYDSSGKFDPIRLISALGGTVKIARTVGRVGKLSAAELKEILVSEASHRKLTFGISLYGDSDKPAIRELLAEIKQLLGQEGVNVRFIEPREGTALTSVVVAHANLIELIVVPDKGQFIVGITVAVQPFDKWAARDIGRPYADAKAGMLPPKVARMAVNLALGPQAGGKKLLDPFCGMGTILAESLLTGASAVGSDISAATVVRAQANLDWLSGQYPGLPEYKLVVSDAVHVSGVVAAELYDVVVTEPFMGTPRLGEGHPFTDKQVSNIVKGLEKLYTGCFKDWHKILKTGGKVVIALPEFALGRRIASVKNVIDTCENLGYTKLLGPLSYSRPQAVVRRNFFVLQKQELKK